MQFQFDTVLPQVSEEVNTWMRLKYSNTLLNLLRNHHYLPYLTACLKHVFVSSLPKRRPWRTMCGFAGEQAESWLMSVRRQTAKDVNKSKAPLNEVRWIECLVIIVLYQLYEFSRNSFPLYAESLEALFYFLFNYIDFSPHNNKLNSIARHCLSYVCDVSNKLLIIFLERTWIMITVWVLSK